MPSSPRVSDKRLARLCNYAECEHLALDLRDERLRTAALERERDALKLEHEKDRRVLIEAMQANDRLWRNRKGPPEMHEKYETERDALRAALEEIRAWSRDSGHVGSHHECRSCWILEECEKALATAPDERRET